MIWTWKLLALKLAPSGKQRKRASKGKATEGTSSVG